MGRHDGHVFRRLVVCQGDLLPALSIASAAATKAVPWLCWVVRRAGSAAPAIVCWHTGMRGSVARRFNTCFLYLCCPAALVAHLR